MIRSRKAALSELGTIILAEILDAAVRQPFESATSSLLGLSEIIGHHPALREEAEAMRRIADAENIITRIRHRRDRF